MVEIADLTIHQLRVFETVVTSGSFSQAALALDIPQPAVSRIISKLEQTTGTRLLHRARNGVSLSKAGESFLINTRQAVRYHDLAIEEARALSGVLIGDVIVAAPDSIAGILFAPLVREIRSTEQNIRLRTIASQSSDISAMVAGGSVDIGIIADTHTQPSGLRDPLFEEELYLIGKKSAPVFRRSEIHLSEAAELPLILNAMPGGLRPMIDKGFAHLKTRPHIKIEIDANNALLDLLLEGEGFSILPYSLLASNQNRQRLAAARIVNPTLKRKISVITATNKPMRSVVRETLNKIHQVTKLNADAARWKVPKTRKSLR